MRVLLVAFGLHGGGAQAVCRAWAEVLRKRAKLVEVLALDGIDDADSIWAEKHGVVLHCGKQISRSLTFASRVRGLRSFVGDRSYSHVICLETYPNLLGILSVQGLRNRPRVVISEHNVPTLILRAEGGARRLQRLLALSLYHQADHCIAVSHAVATDLRCSYRIATSKLSVLPNPALEAIPHSNRDSSALSAAPVLSDSAIRILVPARRAAQKRPFLVGKVAEELARRSKSVQLWWVGDGDEEVQLAHGSDVDLIVRPWENNWHLLADENSVVLLASEYEGLANVLVQATAKGIPVVVGSTALGSADALIPGVTGELAHDDNPESYADAIEKALVRRHGSPPLDVSAWLRRFTRETAESSLLHLLERLSARE